MVAQFPGIFVNLMAADQKLVVEFVILAGDAEQADGNAGVRTCWPDDAGRGDVREFQRRECFAPIGSPEGDNFTVIVAPGNSAWPYQGEKLI
jgi:hypothetical protein